jgi:hypothetical protein
LPGSFPPVEWRRRRRDFLVKDKNLFTAENAESAEKEKRTNQNDAMMAFCAVKYTLVTDVTQSCQGQFKFLDFHPALQRFDPGNLKSSPGQGRRGMNPPAQERSPLKRSNSKADNSHA